MGARRDDTRFLKYRICHPGHDVPAFCIRILRRSCWPYYTMRRVYIENASADTFRAQSDRFMHQVNVLGLTAIITIAALQPLAAQTYYDRQQQNREYRNLKTATDRAYSVPSGSSSTPGYKSPAPASGSSSGSSSSGSSGSSYNYNSTAPAFKTASEREAERREEIKEEYERSRRIREGEAETQRKHAEFESWNQDRHQRIKRERGDFVSAGLKRSAGNTLIGRYDMMEGLCDTFWATKAGYPPLDRSAATAACAAFVRDSATGSYDTLLARAQRARLWPFATSTYLATLYRRFPERRSEIEQEELRAMPYYFGASRPNLMPGVLCSYAAYPPPAIQNADVPEPFRIQLVDRFIELARKYPAQGLVAAGYCRQQNNPFLLCAQACNDDACLAEMYWNVVHTRIAHRGRDYEGPSIDEYVDVTKSDPAASRQLGKALHWLSRNRDAELKALSTEDWREICRGQALSPYQITTLTRDPDYPTAVHYPKLSKAIKNWRKARGDSYDERYVR